MSSPSRPDKGYYSPTNNEGFVTAEGESPPESPPKQMTKSQKKRQKQRAKEAAAAASKTVAAPAPGGGGGENEVNFSGFETVVSKAAERKRKAEEEAAAERKRQANAEAERKRKAEEAAAEQERKRIAAEAERKRKAEEAAAERERKRKAAEEEEAAERKRKADEAKRREDEERRRREEQRLKEAEEARQAQLAFEARLAAERIQSARNSRRAARHARKKSSKSQKSYKSPTYIRGNISKQFPSVPRTALASAAAAIPRLSSRTHIAQMPLIQTEEAQLFTLMVATELFAMYNSTQLNNLIIEHVQSADVRNKLRDPKKRHEVFLFFLKGGAATTIIREHEYLMNIDPEAGVAMSLFHFTSDLDFSLLINPSIPVEDFRTIRAFLLAATLDLLYNIATGDAPEADIPHILPEKRLKDMNKLIHYFAEPIFNELMHRHVTLHNSAYHNRVIVNPMGDTLDDAVKVTPDLSLREYIFKGRPLGTRTFLGLNINLNLEFRGKPLHFTTISLETRSAPKFTLLDIAFPTSENPKANFEWDLASNDIRMLDTQFKYGRTNVRIVFPIVGPVANFVDQAYAALPTMETRPLKVAARQGRAQMIARNILVPHARNFAKTIRAVSKIRFNVGNGTRRNAGNLLRNAMGNAYPNSSHPSEKLKTDSP